MSIQIKSIKISAPRGKNISARLYQADSDTIVIMAHGFCCDKSSGERFDKIADGLIKANYNVINFDFAGCGESDDEIMDSDNMVEDLEAVIDYAKSKGFDEIALYGHSLGAYISLKVYSNKIKTIILSGGVTGPMQYDWRNYFSQEQMAELEAKNYITVVDDSKWRDEIIVGRKTLELFAQVNQKKLLADINCPVLFIHGNHRDDTEEQQLLKHSQAGLKHLQDDSKIVIIDGADHRFYEHIPQLIENIISWLRIHCK